MHWGKPANFPADSRISEDEGALHYVRLVADVSNTTIAATTTFTQNWSGQNADVTGDNAAKSTFVPDTRGDNQPPSWYWSNYPKQVVTELKHAAAIGITGIGYFAPLTTNVPWNGSSGGAIRQTVPDGDNGIFSRKSVSDTSWGLGRKPMRQATTPPLLYPGKEGWQPKARQTGILKWRALVSLPIMRM